MDELKLEKWKNDLNAKAKSMSVDFDPFFKDKKLDDYYSLKLDESSEYTIEITDKLPRRIKERLQQLLAETKPEDSV